MTMPDPNLERTGSEERARGVVPPTERGQDVERTELTHGLAVEGSRPLSADERAAAEHDTAVPERVYAPASERVPREPVPGHRDFVEHTDESTPERRAAAHPSVATEPSFTRVERPSSVTFNTMDSRSGSRWMRLPMGLGSMFVLACGGVGVWLYMRWQRERNKPINRLRRQAQQAASEFRERVPTSPDELRQPAGMGLVATLLSIGLVVWRQMQAQQSRRPMPAVTDADWQQRLSSLKDRWSPRRVEMEKFSISRH